MSQRPSPWIDDGPSTLTFDFHTIRLKVREVGNCPKSSVSSSAFWLNKSPSSSSSSPLSSLLCKVSGNNFFG